MQLDQTEEVVSEVLVVGVEAAIVGLHMKLSTIPIIMAIIKPELKLITILIQVAVVDQMAQAEILATLMLLVVRMDLVGLMSLLLNILFQVQ